MSNGRIIEDKGSKEKLSRTRVGVGTIGRKIAVDRRGAAGGHAGGHGGGHSGSAGGESRGSNGHEGTDSANGHTEQVPLYAAGTMNHQHHHAVIDIDQAPIPDIVQEANPNQNNIQEPLVLEEETLPPPEPTPLRRSTRERRSAMPDDYIVFLQEHEFDIGAVEDNPINFRQA
ncbi:hypothetical protein F0562_022272 [Nyssa sinensis]|uniref:Uncharacterized protein n=1 Tax=Nyssa sinensis TaxID=561372 RepID=A0A5J5BQ75_9ASTE|nr:hypothetical protein F0562_022272 [Nyssa sinensis]